MLSAKTKRLQFNGFNLYEAEKQFNRSHIKLNDNKFIEKRVG